MPTETRPCTYCGKPITRRPSWFVSEHAFCDKACYAQWQQGRRTGKDCNLYRGGKATYACDWCGESFEIYPAWIRKSRTHYCSRACESAARSQWQTGKQPEAWVLIECEWCGKTQQRRRCWTRGEKPRFCSPECLSYWRRNVLRGPLHGNWRGGQWPYGLVWRDARRRARARDDYVCQRCGATENELGRRLDVHHIRPYRETFDHSIGNLISLCRNCHHHCEHHPQDCPQPKPWLALPSVVTEVA